MALYPAGRASGSGLCSSTIDRGKGARNLSRREGKPDLVGTCSNCRTRARYLTFAEHLRRCLEDDGTEPQDPEAGGGSGGCWAPSEDSGKPRRGGTPPSSHRSNISNQVRRVVACLDPSDLLRLSRSLSCVPLSPVPLCSSRSGCGLPFVSFLYLSPRICFRTHRSRNFRLVCQCTQGSAASIILTCALSVCSLGARALPVSFPVRPRSLSIEREMFTPPMKTRFRGN